MTLEEMEAWYIEHVLNDSQGKVEIAAARLAVPRSTLYQKLKKFKLDFGRKVPR
jgi:DNA-binding NtrC family response regulator